MHIAVNPLQYACVKQIAQDTGKTLNECIQEALDDYIRTIGPTIGDNSRYNVIMMDEYISPSAMVH